MRRCRSPIAIDFGEHRVRALQLTRCGDRLAVSAAAVAVVGAASSAGDRLVRLQAAGRRALLSAPFRGRLATPALRLGDVQTRHLRIVHDELERAGELIAAKIEEPPGPPTEVSICPLPISDLIEQGERKREFLCCIAPQPAIDDLIGLCEGIGKTPDRIDLGPLAQARALLHGNPQDSFVHVDIGTSESRVTIVRAGEPVLMRGVPIGGERLCHGISARLQVEPSTLVELAAAVGGFDASLHSAVVDAIAESLEVLVRLVDDGIRYCAALFHGRAVTALRVTGGSAHLPGLLPYLGRRLGITAATVDPFGAIDAGPIPLAQRAEFTTALGLAIGGLPR